MTEKNNNKVSDIVILNRLISMLPFSVERILYYDKNNIDSLNVSMVQCLGLAAKLGADVKEIVDTVPKNCDFGKGVDANILATSISNELNNQPLAAIITATDSISDIEGIKIPEDKKPSKRNDDELTNKVIIDACSMMFASLLNYTIGLAKLKTNSKEASSIIEEACQVHITLILGLIDKLGIKPEDAIAMAATKALVATEDGTDEHKLTEEEINIINDEIADYLPYSLSECTNMVYDMLDEEE